MFPRSEPPSLVLFDCDGVLVDSEKISNIIFTDQLNAAGINLDKEGMQKRYTGMAWPDIRRAVRDEFRISLDDSWYEEYRRQSNIGFEKDLQAVPFAEEAVLAVKQAGIPYCLASSGPLEKVRTTLGITGLLPMFENLMFTGWDVPQSKPAPDLFLMAAEAFGIHPEDCVVIEDSVAGVQAGVAAGMDVLGYSPVGHPHDLSKELAHLFDDMRSVPALLGL